MYFPFNYEQINVAAGTYSPSQVKSYNNKTFDFWVRSLFQRAVSTLDFTLPEEWQGKTRDFFLYCLFRFGFVCVFNDAEYGMTFQPCTLKGQGWYYQPTGFLISNPLKRIEGKLGKDGQILKLTPDFRGVWDVIEYYSEKMSTLDVSINTGLINSQIGTILGAKTKGAVEAIKKALDQAHSGEPTVFVDKCIIDEDSGTEPWQSFTNDLRQTYMVSEQLQDFQTILNNFDTEIGIPTVPYQKKERLIEYEAKSRQIDGTARSLTWYDTLTSSISEVKQLYPDITLSVELRYRPDDGTEEGGAENGEDNLNRGE